MAKPNIADALDLNRFAELDKHADMLANLWAAFQLAAQRGDAACIRYHWDQIRAYSKAVSPLVGALGSKDAANG
jgi:hypothetical protein